MSSSSEKKSVLKQYRKLIDLLKKKFPDVSTKITDGVSRKEFTKREVLNYFVKCTKLYGLYKEEEAISEHIVDNLREVVEKLNSAENSDNIASNKERPAEDYMEEVISYLYEESKRINNLKKPRLPKQCLQTSDTELSVSSDKTEFIDEHDIVFLDGVKLTPNEVAFEEFCIDKFDENRWLEKNYLSYCDE